MDVNAYLARSYEWPPCWLLVTDVYTSELGQTVEEYKTVDGSIRAIASAFRLALHKGGHGFEQVAEPRDYCLVLLGERVGRPPHHVGVYYQGRVLHALAVQPVYQDLASLGDAYPVMQFWARP